MRNAAIGLHTEPTVLYLPSYFNDVNLSRHETRDYIVLSFNITVTSVNLARKVVKTDIAIILNLPLARLFKMVSHTIIVN